MIPDTESVPLIVNADEMDDETFLIHFAKRHPDQMGGLSDFTSQTKRDPELIETYRKFHDKIHELIFAMEEPHEHDDIGKGDDDEEE